MILPVDICHCTLAISPFRLSEKRVDVDVFQPLSACMGYTTCSENSNATTSNLSGKRDTGCHGMPWDVLRTKGLMLPAVNKVSIEDLPGGRGPKAMEAMMQVGWLDLWPSRIGCCLNVTTTWATNMACIWATNNHGRTLPLVLLSGSDMAFLRAGQPSLTTCYVTNSGKSARHIIKPYNTQ